MGIQDSHRKLVSSAERDAGQVSKESIAVHPEHNNRLLESNVQTRKSV
jgi:hypothetical protein